MDTIIEEKVSATYIFKLNLEPKNLFFSQRMKRMTEIKIEKVSAVYIIARNHKPENRNGYRSVCHRSAARKSRNNQIAI